MIKELEKTVIWLLTSLLVLGWVIYLFSPFAFWCILFWMGLGLSCWLFEKHRRRWDLRGSRKVTQNRKNILNYILKYLSNKDEELCGYILGLYKDKNLNIFLDRDSLDRATNHFQTFLQETESSNKSGLSSYEVDEKITNIGTCKKILDFLVDLEKLYKLFKKKNIKTDYFEIMSIFGEIIEKRQKEENDKILNPAYRVISKNLGANISVERVVKEFLKLPSMADGINLIPELLDKFNLKTSEWNLNELIKRIQDKLDLEEFEQNLGSPQEINIEDFTELQGYEFEEYLKNLFEILGYKVIRTPFSSDQGADLIALKDNKKTVVQAKKYTGKVSNSAIQEIVAAKNHYKADKAMVITNSSFTRSAIDLSLSNNVELWDGVKLWDIIESLKTKKKNDFEKRSYVLKKGKDVQIIQILCPFCKQQFDYKVTEKDMTEGATFKTKCSYCGIIVDGTITSRKETWTCEYCGKKFDTKTEDEKHEKICKNKNKVKLIKK